jgi:trigger factor
MDESLVGMKKGDTREVAKDYPADSPKAELAGKTLKMRVTLTTLKQRDLPAIDDELAQDVSEKYHNLGELTTDIRKRLEAQRDDIIKKRKSTLILRQLAAKNPIDLPAIMVDQQVQHQWQQMVSYFGNSTGLLDRFSGELRKNMTKSAEETLRDSLIVGTLMEEKKIECSEKDLEERYQAISDQEGVLLEKVKEEFVPESNAERLRTMIKEEKLLDELFSKASTQKGPKLTFTELLDLPPVGEEEKKSE